MCVTNLHNVVSERVIRAKILFFDSNPIGRIVTRFSKDIMVLDFILPIFFMYLTNGVLRTIVVAVTVGIINPWLFIAIAVAIVFMVLILRHATTAMQKSIMMDGILRGPIHNTFGMIINGLVTLRAHDKFRYFKQDFNITLEKCANATFCLNSTSRWVAIRLDGVVMMF